LEVEIKLKVYESELKRLKESLSKQCVQLEEAELVDYYLSHPCYDMAERDEALRLRVKRANTKEEAELTYKGKRIEEKGVKSREEISVSVSDWANLLNILKAVGFIDFAKVRKVRIDFDCYSYKISLDRVDDLGTYVEIEGKNDCNADCILAVLKKLNIQGEVEKRTYLELILSTRSGNGQK
jgi:adenylate cyclase class 2